MKNILTSVLLVTLLGVAGTALADQNPQPKQQKSQKSDQKDSSSSQKGAGERAGALFDDAAHDLGNAIDHAIDKIRDMQKDD